tara:strand:+ start:101 stop:886 length:786 start_codon:yes stop_codon:yes gene_type:complete
MPMKEKNRVVKSKKKFSKKEKEMHFSKKTGTQSRKHKNESVNIISDKEYLRNQLHRKQINNKFLDVIEYIEKKEIFRPKTKLTEKRLFNLMKKDLQKGYDYYGKYKRVIEREKNDDIILELNAESIQKQKKALYVLALSLFRTNIPNDIHKQIISYGLDGIYIEPNIYKLIPDIVLKAIYEIEEELNNRYLQMEKFEDYIKTKPQFYKLLNKMFCTRFYNYNISEYIFQYTEELLNHNNYHYNNFNNYYNNYQTNYQMIWN